MRLTLRTWLKILRGGGVCLAVAVAIGLTGPFRYEDLGLPFPDFVAHAMIFYALAAVMLATLPRSRSFDLMLALAGVAAASELAQAMVGREMSLHDLAGDLSGVAAALCPVLITRFRLLVREHPDKTFAELRAMDRRRGRRREQPASAP